MVDEQMNKQKNDTVEQLYQERCIFFCFYLFFIFLHIEKIEDLWIWHQEASVWMSTVEKSDKQSETQFYYLLKEENDSKVYLVITSKVIIC